MIRSVLRVIAVCLLAGTLLAVEPAPFYLHDGDRVVFYGDSITDQRLYTLYTELYALTRYPSLNISFVHSGWGGDRVTGGGGGPVDLRLKRDVVAYQPTVVTIMLGMNDGGYTKHKAENDDAFKTGFQHIVESLKQQIPGLRITAIKPSPFDDVTRPFTISPDGYNVILVSYGDWIDTYAKEAKIDVADLNSGVVQVLRNADLADRSNAPKIIPDRVHPGPAGHLIMAEQLLKSWNARAVVSAVTIDAGADAAPQVTREEYSHITGLAAEGGLRWTETEQIFATSAGANDGGRRHRSDRARAEELRYLDCTEQRNAEGDRACLRALYTTHRRNGSGGVFEQCASGRYQLGDVSYADDRTVDAGAQADHRAYSDP